MLLNYTKASSSGQLSNGDWEEFGEEIVFEADYDEVNKALKHILADCTKEDLIRFILSFDGEKVDLEEFFKDELLDYFRKKAMRNG